MCKSLLYPIPTKFSTSTFFTMAAHPYAVELVDGRFNNFGVVGEDTSFEVAFLWTFHADACTREVSRANVGTFHVKNYNFEMYTRTKYSFKIGMHDRVAVEVGTEVFSRFLGVNKPNLDAFFQKRSENAKHRDHIVTLF